MESSFLTYTMKAICLFLLLVQFAQSMFIPEDTETIDGFLPVGIAHMPNDDEYFEAKSLSSGSLLNSIRNKRNANYEIHESDGISSHFRPNTVNGFKTIPSSDTEKAGFRKLFEKILTKIQGQTDQFVHDPLESTSHVRLRRSAEDNNNNRKSDESSMDDGKKSKNDNSQKTSKFMSTSNGFSPKTRSSPLASPLVSSKWTRTPFEYSKIQLDEDSLAMDTMDTSSSSAASTINEGIKARTPRVNFVTQQKKSLDQNGDSKASGTKSEFYKSPPLLHNTKEMASGMDNDRYAETNRQAKPTSYSPEYSYRERGNANEK